MNLCSALPVLHDLAQLVSQLCQVLVGTAAAAADESLQLLGHVQQADKGGGALSSAAGYPLGLQHDALGQHHILRQIVDLLIERRVGGDAPVVEGLGKQVGDRAVAVDHKDLLGSGAEAADPVQQVGAVGVGAEPLKVDDACVDGDLLAEEFDGLGAFQQPPAQRALRLVAHEHHGALAAPQVVLQVVTDTAGITHAGGGDNDLGPGVQVQGLGLVGGLNQSEPREGKQVFSAMEDGDGLFIQVAPQVPGVDLGGLGSQGTVHAHLEVGS